MKKIYIYLYIVLFLLPLTANAQRAYRGGIGFEQPQAEKQGDRVRLLARLNIDELELDRQHLLTVTPILRSTDRQHQIAFEPVGIIGKTRLKALERAILLDGFRLAPQPSRLLRYDKNNREPIRFEFDVPYEPWMRNAELVVAEEVTGCRNEVLSAQEHRVISPPLLPPVYTPTYQITYAEPPTEPVKQRSESYAARINFVVNRYEIRRDYMNNAAVLDEVDQIIGEVKNDENLTITEFKVTGYASPEGAAASNLTLSENRAKSFVEYVRNRHGIAQNVMQVDWKGDDWDGLRKAMEESNFSDKNRVLDILNNTSDVQQRKNQLRNMGAPYRALLDEYYPYLRRNEYTIAYVARPFSVEEAKVLIRTKPQHLSLNEMFLVANTYPKDSREFKEVFDIAVRMYPESDYANMNSAALDIENGALDVALERSLKVNMPEAWNNIGYIYVQKKDYAKAAEYFKRAADAGLQVAAENLRQLNKWLEDPE